MEYIVLQAPTWFPRITITATTEKPTEPTRKPTARYVITLVSENLLWWTEQVTPRLTGMPCCWRRRRYVRFASQSCVASDPTGTITVTHHSPSGGFLPLVTLLCHEYGSHNNRPIIAPALLLATW